MTTVLPLPKFFDLLITNYSPSVSLPPAPHPRYTPPMPADWKTDTALPEPIRTGLVRFCDQLTAALGEQLLAITLYGGLAKGEFVAGNSDVNVLVVLRTASLATLDALVPALEQARNDFPLALLTLTETELPIATEVFPIKFTDLQRHHRTLVGREIFAQLEITRDRLRRQCARELQNLLLRSRAFYLQRGRRPEQLEETLTHAISSLLATLGALIELKTGERPDTKSATVARADQLGLNAQLLRDLLALKRGELKPNADQLKQLFGAFLETIHQAARLTEKL